MLVQLPVDSTIPRGDLTSDQIALNDIEEILQQISIAERKPLNRNTHRSCASKMGLLYGVRRNFEMTNYPNSPSGKYQLIIESIPAPVSGQCATTKGTVTGPKGQLAVVFRNYSSFPFLWVENHPNGHDYLICGEDYQGQTVIELDTGIRQDILSVGAEHGFGFCWSGYVFDAKSQLLIVEGCIWAAPFEFRFYDFSDPMNGWEELVSDEFIDSDYQLPIIEGNKITCFKSKKDKEGKLETMAKAFFERQGNQLVLIDEWLSEEEKVDRAERKAYDEKFEAWCKNFKTKDPIYLAAKDCLARLGLTTDFFSMGGGFQDGWTIYLHVEGHKTEIKWHSEKGPIWVGKEEFPFSVEGMEEAAFALKESP